MLGLRNPFKAQISQLFLDLLDKLNSEDFDEKNIRPKAH